MKDQKNCKSTLILLSISLVASLSSTRNVAAAPEPFIGEMMLVPYSFCPKNWTEASGQQLLISQHQALFSLLGTTYGGDGRTTFAVPDLRGRAPIHGGYAPGMSTHYREGQRGGSDSFYIAIENMPSHNHRVQASNNIANKSGPGRKLPAVHSTDFNMYHDGGATRLMNEAMITHTGGNQPIYNRSPYLVMKWCIAINGTYPSRH